MTHDWTTSPLVGHIVPCTTLRFVRDAPYGDLGSEDEDGYFSFYGRVDDVIPDYAEAGSVVVEQDEPAVTEPPQVTTEPSEPDAGIPWAWLVLALRTGLGVAGVALRRHLE